jgi:hypothetical protein
MMHERWPRVIGSFFEPLAELLLTLAQPTAINNGDGKSNSLIPHRSKIYIGTSCSTAISSLVTHDPVTMWSNSQTLVAVLLTLFSGATSAFSFQLQSTSKPIAFANKRAASPLYSSFAADGSEYSSKDSKEGEDDDDSTSGFGGGFRDDDETATVELQPIPTSKNSGNRFVAFVWDQVLDNIYGSGSADSDAAEPKDQLDLHYDRMQHTEDHVMFCRKTNLYNDTFNTESQVDILWSLPMYVHYTLASLIQAVETSSLSHFLFLFFFQFVIGSKESDWKRHLCRNDQTGIRPGTIGPRTRHSESHGWRFDPYSRIQMETYS